MTNLERRSPPPKPRGPGPTAYLGGFTGWGHLCHVCFRVYFAETWHRVFNGHWPFPYQDSKEDEYELMLESEEGRDQRTDTWMRRLFT